MSAIGMFFSIKELPAMISQQFSSDLLFISFIRLIYIPVPRLSVPPGRTL